LDLTFGALAEPLPMSLVGQQAPDRARTRRPGWTGRIDGPGAGMAVAGEYRTVEPPRLLAFTWTWDGASGRAVGRATPEFRAATP